MDSILAARKLMNTSKLKSRFTPTATATSQSCAYMALHAASVATNEDEHAVSIVIEGPTNPNTYANQLEKKNLKKKNRYTLPNLNHTSREMTGWEGGREGRKGGREGGRLSWAAVGAVLCCVVL